MGFEVRYIYHERLEEGGYDRDNSKDMKKRVGDPFEDVPLEKLASAVMAQLARRDIWVTDVEIYEVSKKKITFKESKGGIVIKNKKFSLDGEQVVVQEMVEAAPQANAHPHNLLQPARAAAPESMPNVPVPNGRPLKWVVFQPSEMKTVKERGLRFTVDKRYPVYHEALQKNGVGLAYKTVDDLGREQIVPDEYFIPDTQTLFADRELRFSESAKQREGGKLLWHGTVEDNEMPNLR